MIKNKKLIKYWLWPLLYILAIFWLSSLNITQSARLRFFYFDKIIHIVEYAFLSIFFIRAFSNTTSLEYIDLFFMTLTIVVLIGGLNEYYQSFFDYRQASSADFLADAVGAVSGIIIYRKVSK
jgi:VanZ family protein